MSAEDPQREPDQLDGIALPEQAAHLIGHQKVFDGLCQQTNDKRLPGAILLHGPKGIGKATLAFALTKHILTESGDEPQGRVYEQVFAGVHPNIFTIRRRPREKAKGFYASIRVEDIRQIQQRMRQTRGRAGYRICVVDSIDDCNQNAANALLKILEEPPAETIFLLVSHRPGSLLPTIRSRCHAYALRGLSNDHVKHVVTSQVDEADQVRFDDAVSLADGRPQRAFEALLLDGLDSLNGLRSWLASPSQFPTGTHLDLAATICKSGGAEEAFAREILIAWLAQEAHTASLIQARSRLASATQLWDKAHTMFAEADAYNLDAKQTLISIFDALRQHVKRHVDLTQTGSS